MKLCTSCGKEKDAEEFAKDKRRKDGYDSRCKLCSTVRTRKYQPTVFGNVQSRTKTRADTIRQSLVAKHGIALVEAMESVGDCYADLRDIGIFTG